jgi:biopolymer transport protein ExbB
MVEAALFWVRAGGPVVIVLAVLSVVSVALIAGKAVQLARARAGGARRSIALRDWAAGATDAAIARLAPGRAPADRVVAVGMRALLERKDEAALRSELEGAGAGELDTLGTHLAVLETIAMAAPLLGLLGTVLGMIESFRALELARGAADASLLAGGVWTALLTTAMGLMVAIPAGAAAMLFAARIDSVGRDIERSVAELLAAERDRCRQ